MYPPKYYLEYDKTHLHTLIEQNPLATVLTQDLGSFPDISHIPFHLNESNSYLIGHVSNQHPLARKLKENKEENICLIFHGPDTYISPNYSEQQVVPTWNYQKVHIKGKAVEIVDNTQKYHQMCLTTQHFEQGQATPWSLDLTPDIAISQMLKAITIFKVSIDEFTGIFKMSQNKPDIVRKQIATQLALKNDNEFAQKMSNG